MSDSPSLGFGKFVPGFDFLQNLAKGATQNIPQMPNLGNWVAPTLNVEELDKRIEELKAVQFWLDQNAMALKATIQALEVQKMTLATLKGMNFNMGDVANAFKLKAADTVMSGVQKVTDTAAGAAGAVSGVAGAVTGVASGMASMASDVASAATAKRSAAKAEAKAAAAPAGGLVDPLQWWGALTQQFQQIAASAMKRRAPHSPKCCNVSPASARQNRCSTACLRHWQRPSKPPAQTQPGAAVGTKRMSFVRWKPMRSYKPRAIA